MRTRFTHLLFAALLLAPRGAFAAGVPTIKLRVFRPTILNNGRDQAEIIAEARDSTGSYVANGTIVRFETNLGYFQPDMTPSSTAAVQSGQARIKLAGTQKGTAKIYATIPGAVSEAAEVTLTDDPTETFEGNAYVDMLATGSLL